MSRGRERGRGGRGEGTCPHHRALRPHPILRARVPAPHLPRPPAEPGTFRLPLGGPFPSWVGSARGGGPGRAPEMPGGQPPPLQRPPRKPGSEARPPAPRGPAARLTHRPGDARQAGLHVPPPPGRPWAHRRAHAARSGPAPAPRAPAIRPPEAGPPALPAGPEEARPGELGLPAPHPSCRPCPPIWLCPPPSGSLSPSVPPRSLQSAPLPPPPSLAPHRCNPSLPPPFLFSFILRHSGCAPC